MPVTHYIRCKAFDVIYKFSDFPHLKDVTITTGLLKDFTCNGLMRLMEKNLDPGPTLRKITLMFSGANGYFGEKEDSIKDLQRLILSEPYKSVKWEFKLLRVKLNLLAEMEKYIRQKFPRVLGHNEAGPRVRLSLTGRLRCAQSSRLDTILK